MRPIRLPPPLSAVFFSPKIYLPVGLDPQDRPYVLLHEQAHLRRRDHLTKPLAWLALCLHWCNPLLWLAYRLFCRDLETACDQASSGALAPRTPPNTPPPCCTWDTAASCPRRCPWPLGRRTPKGRIRHVLDYKRPPGLGGRDRAAGVCGHHRPDSGQPRGTGGPDGRGRHHRDLYLQLRGTPVRLPEELQTSLVSLLRDYDQEDYTPLAQFSLPNGALLLTNANRGTQFCLFLGETGAPVLVRLNHDGYSASQKEGGPPGIPPPGPPVARFSDLPVLPI